MTNNKQLKNYLVEVNYKTIVKANNIDEAYEKFFEDVETTPQQTLQTFVSDNLTIEQTLEDDIKKIIE